jgi:aldose 1-epimerase
MTSALHTIENDYWQVGILPETGASVAFGRVRQGDRWVDILRPTAPADYDNSSNCASFVLVPWSNRIRDGRFAFRGQTYQLEINNADGTAIHGDTRKRIWQVESAGHQRINLSFNSTTHTNINFPFQFAATAEYWLDGPEFVMQLSLRNVDDQPFPGGFGQHPYFVLPENDNVWLELPVDQEYPLTNALPSGPPQPLAAALDFRELRQLRTAPPLDNLFRGRQGDKPVRIVYPDLKTEIQITSSAIFEHLIVYSPPGQPFFAVEPVTNANDGFNLLEQGVAGSGVFVLEPNEGQAGAIRLRYNALS